MGISDYLFANRTLRQKITFPLVAMVVLVFLVMGITDFAQQKSRSEALLQQKLNSTVQLADIVLANALWNFNDEIIADLADALMQDPEVVYVSIRTQSGIPLFEKKSPIHEQNPHWTSLADKEILYAGKTIGIVRIGVTAQIQQQYLYAELAKTLARLLTIIVAMSLIIFVVTRYMTHPIELLERGAEEIARGNLDHTIEINSTDEIGRLAEKFNEMRESLSVSIRALDASKEKYSKAFTNLSEVIGLMRIADQTFVEVNDAFYTVLGYSQDEVIGKRSLDFHLWEDPEDRNRFYEQIHLQKAIHNLETRWLTKAGECRTGLLSVEVINIDGVEHELFVWNDITHLKENERLLEEKVDERSQALKAASEQLIQSEKLASLGGLVSGIAHEINTPVGICVTCASYLNLELQKLAQKHEERQLKRSDFEEFITLASELAKSLTTNLGRANTLIASFKNIAADKTHEELREFAVKSYMNQVIVSLSPLFRHTDYTVEYDCPEDVEIRSYPGALAQIVTNLVSNSIRHGFEGRKTGRIFIGFERNDHHNRMTYRDDGVGIPPDILKYIYDPFFTTKRGAQGFTGLGLHIVYNIVTQQLGGTIGCRNIDGGGTEFVIHFDTE